MTKILLRSLLLLAIVVAVAAVAVWRAFEPPAPLQPAATQFTLRDVTVVNPGAGRAAHQTVSVRDGLVQLNVTAGTGAAQARYAGMYVLPGLADMHSHLPPGNPLKLTSYFMLLNLAHGVTAVRDAGDLDGTSLPAHREAVRKGHPGPRVFACGPFVSAGARKWANTVLLQSPDDADAAVAKLKADGSHCIKAYDGLSLPMVRALNRAADKYGLTLMGHVPEGLRYEETLLPDVQHLMGVAPKLPVGDDHRLMLVRGWQDVDDAGLQAVVAATRQSGIANTPTLVQESKLLSLQDYAQAKDSAEARLIPRFYPEVVWHPVEGLAGYRNMSAADFDLVRVAHAKKAKLVRMLYEAGLPLRLGTDAQQPFVIPGIALQHEMREFEQAGIPVEAIWRMATREAGASLRLAGLGRVEDGAPADLLVFREDPTTSLNALGSLEAVIVQGHLYPKAEIDAKLAEYRAHYDGFIFDRLSTQLARLALRKVTVADPH